MSKLGIAVAVAAQVYFTFFVITVESIGGISVGRWLLG